MKSEIHSIALALYEANDTPVSLGCALQLKYGDLKELVSRKIDPSNYLNYDRDKFFRDYSSVSFLKKLSVKIPGLDPKARAEESFLACEAYCHETNVIWSDIQSGLTNDGLVREELRPYLPFVMKVRKVLRSLLGPLPRELEPAFGPGATLSDSGQRCAIIQKMMSKPTATRSAWTLIDPLWADRYRDLFEQHSVDLLPEFTRGNRFTTVPKTAVTDRPICIEPSLLIYFQKGLGSVLRSRLRRFGIRLDRGQHIHQKLLLSNPDGWATLDLSSASDTISYQFVRAVMPDDWFAVLSSFRSPFSLFRGKWHKLEKFSSMGNGYTFELETILFLSVLVALDDSQAPGRDLFVYGDDIIIRPHLFQAARGVLTFCGFKINEDKSFGSGPFKESCGVDVFAGTNVRPYFVKELPDDPPSFIALCNGLRHLASRYSGDYRVYDLYRRPWLRAMDALPGHIRRLRGPSSFGDVLIYDDDAVPKLDNQGRERWKALIPQPRRLQLCSFPPQAVMAAALYGTLVGQGWTTKRGDPSGHRIRTLGG